MQVEDRLTLRRGWDEQEPGQGHARLRRKRELLDPVAVALQDTRLAAFGSRQLSHRPDAGEHADLLQSARPVVLPQPPAVASQERFRLAVQIEEGTGAVEVQDLAARGTLELRVRQHG